jgi:hypothetical protein
MAEESKTMPRVTRYMVMVAWCCLAIGGVLMLLALGDRSAGRTWGFPAMVMCAAGAVLGLIGALTAIVRGIMAPPTEEGSYFLKLVLGLVAAVGGGFGALISMFAGVGGLHGRPLRVAGKAVQGAGTRGPAWAEGAAPVVADLSPETCAALAGLWRRDALLEHASVPAFSRIAWTLAGLGAPPELLAGAHAAALDEVGHARGCFALVAGYTGVAEEPGPLPALLGAGPEPGDAMTAMALESLRDGCLLEGFSADVAARACERATDPAARALVARIAVDEAGHAELAWQILEWCVGRSDAARTAVSRCVLAERGPVAYGPAEARLVARADPRGLAAHGRVPADEWAGIYAARLAATRARVAELLAVARAA